MCCFHGDARLFSLKGGYATYAFEEVGHSSDAKELMKTYLIGTMAEVNTGNASRLLLYISLSIK